MGIIRRAAYLGATYTGQRAAWNRVRAASLPALRAEALDGGQWRVGDALLRVRVHRRPRPAGLGREWRAGMLSLRLAEAPVGRLRYGLLLATSHFGCGHLEVAFCERGGEVVVYGLRNVLRSNVERWGLGRAVPWLQAPADASEALRALAERLGNVGLATFLAEPADCARLCVDPGLVPRAKRSAVMRALRDGYARRWRRVRRADPSLPMARPLLAPSSARRTPRRRPLVLAALALHPASAVAACASFPLHMMGHARAWPEWLGVGARPEALGLHAELVLLLSWSLALGALMAGALFAPRFVGVPMAPRLARWLDGVGLYARFCFAALFLALVLPPSLHWVLGA